MGVKGLTSFIKTNKRSLAKELTFSARKEGDDSERTPLVVDAWGIIYPLYRQTDVSSTFGGSFLDYKKNLIHLLEAWRSVGLEPIFVFDGCPSSQKHKTMVNRLDQTNKNLELFWRTNPQSRQSIALNAVPPLLAELTVDVLKSTNVEYKMEESEADSAVVHIAKSRNGLWAGGDSDLLIHDADAETQIAEKGGYAPLLEMEWVAERPEEPADEVPEEEDDGFATVSKAKHPRNIRKKEKFAAKVQTTLEGYDTTQIFIRSRLFAPPTTKIVALRMAVYDPKTLAEFVGIKALHLPLLAALVGNDSSPQIQSHYLHRGTRPEERITRVANVLKEYSGENAQQSLVEYAVQQLVDPETASGVHEEIAADVMKASADYIGVENANVFSEDKFDKEIVEAYKAAYLDGRLSPKILEIMQERVYFCRFIMEFIDERSSHVEVGRHLRQFAYMITLATCKEDLRFKKIETIETVEEVTEEEKKAAEEAKAEEQGEEGAQGAAAEVPEGEQDENAEAQPQTKITTKTVEYAFNAVTEYTRHGVTTTPVPVEIPSIEDVLPAKIDETKKIKDVANVLPPFPTPTKNSLQLLPLRERLALYLSAHSSSHLSVPLAQVIASAPNLTQDRHALTTSGKIVKGVNEEGPIGDACKAIRPYVPFTAAVRHIILSVRDSAKAWNEGTLEAVINMAIKVFTTKDEKKEEKKEESEEEEHEEIVLESPSVENVRAASQVLCALENSQIVADALLLSGIVTPCHTFFDGPTLHRYFAGVEEPVDKTLTAIIKESILDGCPERTVTVKKVKKNKKEKKEKSDDNKEKKDKKQPASRYDILAAMGMD
ncbi:PIN domain-like protein [Wallemia mellicola]|uniref:PIN domain-like protein n=1 Tax=Wallemia mellicola TaxID=1708541 RepID=A0A4T0QLR3_9BASI|nr:PIN domain-like protein [Wallemia mellicola]